MAAAPHPSPAAGRERRITAAAVLLAAFAIYWFSPVVTSIDSVWTIPAAVSLERHGDLDLSEYRETFGGAHTYGIREVRGRPYDYFPYGTAVLVTPVVAAFDFAARLSGRDLERELQTQRISGDIWGRAQSALELEHGLGALLGALAAAIIFLVGSEFLPRNSALLLAGAYALGTGAWSVASRALWNVGPAALLVATGLLLAIRAERRPSLVPLMGLALTGAVVVRPTALPALVALCSYAWWRFEDRRAALGITLAAAVVTFLAANLAVYHSALPPYDAADRVGVHRDFGEALLGTLMSPSRGLLVFSPVLFGVIVGAVAVFRRGDLGALGFAAAGAIVAHWLMVSAFRHWWGGASYGPRLMFDVMPLWAFLAIPTISAVGQARAAAPRRFTTAALGAGLALSIAIHGRGALDRRTYRWNSQPVHVDRDPSRVWDWTDPMFLRDLW